jgi:hypothetical protein
MWKIASVILGAVLLLGASTSFKKNPFPAPNYLNFVHLDDGTFPAPTCLNMAHDSDNDCACGMQCAYFQVPTGFQLTLRSAWVHVTGALGASETCTLTLEYGTNADHTTAAGTLLTTTTGTGNTLVSVGDIASDNTLSQALSAGNWYLWRIVDNASCDGVSALMTLVTGDLVKVD